MIQIAAVASVEDLRELRKDYLASLTAPLDGMWETFATMGRHMEVRSAGRRRGYFSLNDQGLILQFHLSSAVESRATEIFSKVISSERVKGAMVSTADPLFLSLCLDVHEKVTVHTYLYQDHNPQKVPEQEEPQPFLELVEPGELRIGARHQLPHLTKDLHQGVTRRNTQTFKQG